MKATLIHVSDSELHLLCHLNLRNLELPKRTTKLTVVRRIMAPLICHPKLEETGAILRKLPRYNYCIYIRGGLCTFSISYSYLTKVKLEGYQNQKLHFKCSFLIWLEKSAFYRRSFIREETFLSRFLKSN